jgi:hypothetical protein
LNLDGFCSLGENNAFGGSDLKHFLENAVLSSQSEYRHRHGKGSLWRLSQMSERLPTILTTSMMPVRLGGWV